MPCGWQSRRWTCALARSRRWRESSTVFGAARPHHAYLFANRRANRMKVLVHDGIGVWLAARRLNQGKFVWPRDGASTLTLTRAQLDALVLGLPWARIGEAGVIRVL
jgi:transposase